MAKQSGFLSRQKEIQNNVIHAAEVLAKQYMVDTLQITMHKDFGWGYDRQKQLLDAWETQREAYRAALDPKDPEADVAQAHMDTALLHLIAGKQPFYPFPARYPELKKVTYGK